MVCTQQHQGLSSRTPGLEAQPALLWSLWCLLHCNVGAGWERPTQADSRRGLRCYPKPPVRGSAGCRDHPEQPCAQPRLGLQAAEPFLEAAGEAPLLPPCPAPPQPRPAAPEGVAGPPASSGTEQRPCSALAGNAGDRRQRPGATLPGGAAPRRRETRGDGGGEGPRPSFHGCGRSVAARR